MANAPLRTWIGKPWSSKAKSSRQATEHIENISNYKICNRIMQIIKFPTGIRRWGASLKQSPSLPHQHFCNRINTIKLLSSKVENNKNHSLTSPPWSKSPTPKPLILQMQTFGEIPESSRGTSRTHDLSSCAWRNCQKDHLKIALAYLRVPRI